jgi:hypothetical protein
MGIIERIQHPGWVGVILPLLLAIGSTFTPGMLRVVLLVVAVIAATWVFKRTELGKEGVWKTGLAALLFVAVAVGIFFLGHRFDAQGPQIGQLSSSPNKPTTTQEASPVAAAPQAASPQGKVLQESKHKPKSSRTEERGVSTAQAPVAIAPNGIANAAPNFGNQNVNNFAPPERHLTKQESADLATVVASMPDPSIIKVEGAPDVESQAFSLEIWAPFRARGVKDDMDHYPIPLLWSGNGIRTIAVLLHDDTGNEFPYAQRIASILKHNDPNLIFQGDSSVSPGRITILIGPRPETRPQ